MTMTNAELEIEINSLKSQLAALQGSVGSKAEASAVNALNTRITNVENVNTSQGNAISNLNNSLSAVQSPVTALENK